MPIIVDPTTPEPAPPTVMTGPDGILTARVDAAHAGVLLTADFTGYPEQRVHNPSFDTDITGWDGYQVGGTTTLSQETTAPLAGAGSLKATWTDLAGSAGASTAGLDEMPPGMTGQLTFTAHIDVAVPILRVALNDGTVTFRNVDLTPPAAGVTRAYTVNLTLAPGQTLRRLYVYATGGSLPAGSMLLDDVELVAKVQQVVFWRTNPDGTAVTVRSGNPAPAPGSYAVAYDHEARLGVGVAWQAVPIIGGIPGDASDSVAGAVPEPTGEPVDPGLWLKCLEDPGLSRQVMEQSWVEVDYDQDVAITRPVGSKAPAASMLTPGTAGASTLTVLAPDLATETAIRAIGTAGVFLAQSKQAYGRDDRYWVATSIKVTRTSDKVMVGWRAVALEMQEVARPDTTGQGLRVPGRSFADRAATYPTFDLVPPRTFVQALTG